MSNFESRMSNFQNENENEIENERSTQCEKEISNPEFRIPNFPN